MYSKKSEKRKKKKKMKKKPKKRTDKQITRIPGMFPSPIMGSNSIIYQPPQMTREDPVAQINIRNTEAVRNRLLLENITDLVSPQRRLEKLALSNPPIVESSTPRETLNKQPNRPQPNRSTSLDSGTPTAKYLSLDRISLVPLPGEEIQINEYTSIKGDDVVIKRPKKVTGDGKKGKGGGVRSSARSPTKRNP
jgi:hypothetical protein